MSRPEPRAHWILLYLSAAVAFALLCLNGYVSHIGDEGDGSSPPVVVGGAVPASVTDGGPILRFAPNGTITSRAMPAKTIALTFDDGPDPRYTPQILALLARYHAHATFFEIGSLVDRYPDLSRRVVAGGNEIGSHTFTHVDPATTASWRLNLEMTWSAAAIAGATGVNPVLLRPPYSSVPSAVTGADLAAMRRIGAAGYLVTVADHDTDDWRRPGVAAIVTAATPAHGSGAVVMMHDAGGDRSQTVTALGRLLPQLQARRAIASSPCPRRSSSEPRRGHRRRSDSAATSSPGHSAPVDGWRGALTILMAVALGLSALRLLVQLWCARRHHRAQQRSAQRRRTFLGPVSVIVPAYNEAANIAATVRSLVASDYPDLEVIVVDDGSSDDTAEIVRALRLPRVTRHRAGQRR